MNMKARGKRIAIDNIVSLKMEALPILLLKKKAKTDSENELIEEENNVTPAEPSNMEKEQGTQMTLF